MATVGRNILVVGQGSIGLRHRDVIESLGYSTITVSRRAGIGKYASVEAALAGADCDAAVVATETGRHASDLAELARLRFRGPVVVEKPLVARSEDLTTAKPGGPIYVGYNLRFLPVVVALQNLLKAEEKPFIAAQLHVGQAYESWRPDRDPASVYSAHRDQGGGALRDLSHELDLAMFLFGNVTRVSAIGGRYTKQTVDSDDAWSILAVAEKCHQLTVTLSGIDAAPSRYIAVTTEKHRYHADLMSGVLTLDGNSQIIASQANDSYRGLWSRLLENGPGALCDWNTGAAVVHLIDAIEAASMQRRWVDLTQ